MSIFTIEFRPGALRDLRSIEPQSSKRILAKIDGLQSSLSGDVKRLTNFTPEYRLRVGGVIKSESRAAGDWSASVPLADAALALLWSRQARTLALPSTSSLTQASALQA